MTYPDDGLCAKHDLYFDIADGLVCPICEGVEEERRKIIKLLNDNWTKISDKSIIYLDQLIVMMKEN